MTTIGDLRRGSTRGAVVLAIASAALLVGGEAWLVWQALEGDDPTILRSEFRTWFAALVVTTVVVAGAGAVFWRVRRVRWGLVAGLALAALGIVAGLVVDIVTSAS